MRNGARILAIALLAITGVVGLFKGVGEMGSAQTRLQQSVQIGVLLYGILGSVGAVGLTRRKSWSVVISAAWALVVTYVASVASFAFSDPTFLKSETLAGVMASGIVTALIGALVVWVARAATRDQRLPGTAESGHIPSP